ncbi:MAG: MFS transporter [Halobacteriales archaeon]|nr:MFS transporter [Halobacteriales archaeon]
MAQTAGRRVPVASYYLLGLGTAAYFLYTFSWFSVPAYLNPIITDLGLTSTEAGIVTGAVQLSYIPLSLVSGLVIDRFGSRRSLAIGIVIIATAHVLRAIAGGFVTILLPTLLLGVGGTSVTFGLPKLVSELFPAERSGSMSSVYIVGATLGSATAFGIARPVLGPAAGGWRPLFLSTGVFVFGFAALWIVSIWLLWDRVEQFGSAGEEQSFSLTSAREDVYRVLTHRGLLLLVVIGTMRLFISHGLSAWLPTILEARGLAVGLAGTITSLFVIIRILGIVTIPALSDRYSTRRLPIIACGLAGAVGMLGLLAGGGIPVLLASLVLIGVFIIGGLSPLIRAIPIEMAGIGPRLTAVATGLIFTVGEIGGFMGPFLIGALEDLTGSFLPGIAVLAAGSVVTVVAGYVMAEPGQSDRADSEPAGEPG